MEQLTKKTSTNIDHKKSLLDTATELNNLKYHDASEAGAKVNHDDIKLAIQEATSSDSVLEHLWNCPGVRDFFSKRENSSNLEDLMSLSSSSTPLNTFPPDIDSNIYCDIISYGLKHSKGMIVLLINLLIKNECPVQEKDVVRVAYIYSLLAQSISRKNNTLAKTKSLVLQAQGITQEGLNALSFLGICEGGTATRKSTDLLAEVTDSLLRMSCRTNPTQVCVDNLDFLQEHMTINYKEVEGTSTSHLSDIGMNSELVPDLYHENEILIENEKHVAELNHLKTVVANTIGRVLSDRVEKAKVLRKFLPLNYVHPNSDKKQEPANIMIQKPEPLQETVNAEFVQYLDNVQRNYLEKEVAESVQDKDKYFKDLKTAYDVNENEEVREAAIDRLKVESVRHGVWIGHGDLLTMSMFYVALSLRFV